MGARGCGTREAGGVYLETEVGGSGPSIMDYLVDPPMVVNVDALGLSPRGVQLVEQQGTWHVMDWVGRAYYPNVTDFIEEMKHMGVSRRVSANLDFAKLTDYSRLLLVHAKAYIERFDKYIQYRDSITREVWCPKAGFLTEPEEEMCIGLTYFDVEGGEPVEGTLHEVRRRMPWGSYRGYEPALPEAEHRPALFAALPITNAAVVRGAEDSHLDTLARVREQTLLRVDEEEE